MVRNDQHLGAERRCVAREQFALGRGLDVAGDEEPSFPRDDPKHAREIVALA